MRSFLQTITSFHGALASLGFPTPSETTRRIRTLFTGARAMILGAAMASTAHVLSASAQSPTPVPPSYVSEIGFSRYTDLGGGLCSWEYGLLGPTGFIPAYYSELPYAALGTSQAQVLPISGKIVVAKAVWTQWQGLDSAFTSKFSVSSQSDLNHVPFMVAQWTSGASGATPVPPSYVSEIGFSRYTDLGGGEFSWEYGLLGPSGFIPANYSKLPYGSMGITQAEVLPISGKIVVTKAVWTQWQGLDSAFTSKFSVSSQSDLNHVPFMVAQWTSGASGATPVPPSYVSEIGFSCYTDLGGGEYSWEYGLLGPSGFIPASYMKLPYGTMGTSQAEVLPISGKIVVTKAVWTQWQSINSSFTSKFSVSSPGFLDHVPFMVAQWAGAASGATPVPPSYVSEIGFSRYTDLGGGEFSWEYGLLGPSGFIPASYSKLPYGSMGTSLAEVLPISGKIVVTKAVWAQWEGIDSSFTGKFSLSSPGYLDHVPFMVAQWAGGAAGATPVPPTYIAEIGFSRYTSLGGAEYSWEYGLLGPSGFIPASYMKLPYGAMGTSQAEVLPISGKIVVAKAVWTQWQGIDSSFTSKFSVSSPGFLDHVPFMVVRSSGGNAIPVASDFNADGKSDLLWENTATGQRFAWLMNGTAFASGVDLGTLSAEWHIAGTGDFNGDGKTDIVWENSSTGDRYVWLMNGSTFSSSVYLGNLSAQWHIAGTGDFNADGKTDLVWENTSTGDRYIWLMNGTAWSASVSLGNLPTQWRIVGTGDFNADGKTDLAWENTSTGDRYVWLMNGTTYASSAYLGNAPVLWHIAGAGDFNGDGQPDILWENTATGERGLWLMSGTSFSSWASLGTVATQWRIGN